MLDYLTIACLSVAVALVLDELWDGRTHPGHGLKWRDLLNPRSHEFVIIILLTIGLIVWIIT